MVVGTGFGVGVDVDGAGPDFLGADTGEVDGGGAVHAGGLGGVGVQAVAGDDADAVFAPVWLGHGEFRWLCLWGERDSGGGARQVPVMPDLVPMPPALPVLAEPPGLRRHQRLARTLLAVALVCLGLYIIEGFLRALVWAAIIALATWPLYQRALRRFPARAGGHGLLLPIVFTLLSGLVFVGPLGILAVELGLEARAGIVWLNEIRAHGVPLPDALAHLPVFQSQVSGWWHDNLADPEGARALLGRVDRAEAMAMGRTLGGKVLHDLVLFTFTLVTLFFLYCEGTRLTDQMLVASRRLFGPPGERVGRQIVASVHGTVDGLVLVGLGTGFILGIFYAIAGVPHPALLGAATAIGAMVPLGATITLTVACVLVFAVGKGVTAVVLFGAGFVVIFAADHFVRPKLIGGATKLPFLWVLLGILGGVETFGLLGLFLGPATMAALILLWREWVGDATSEGER